MECNPRAVEPGNAYASGVNIPALQVRLTIGEQLAGQLLGWSRSGGLGGASRLHGVKWVEMLAQPQQPRGGLV
jgi:hypothetical protein